jgi:hypothetical protein
MALQGNDVEPEMLPLPEYSLCVLPFALLTTFAAVPTPDPHRELDDRTLKDIGLQSSKIEHLRSTSSRAASLTSNGWGRAALPLALPPPASHSAYSPP